MRHFDGGLKPDGDLKLARPNSPEAEGDSQPDRPRRPGLGSEPAVPLVAELESGSFTVILRRSSSHPMASAK
jgi:hypothetical protein